jgi:hypothetical protein
MDRTTLQEKLLAGDRDLRYVPPPSDRSSPQEIVVKEKTGGVLPATLSRARVSSVRFLSPELDARRRG